MFLTLTPDEMPSFNLSTSSDVVSQSFLIVAMNLASWGTDSRSGLNCFWNTDQHDQQALYYGFSSYSMGGPNYTYYEFDGL